MAPDTLARMDITPVLAAIAVAFVVAVFSGLFRRAVGAAITGVIFTLGAILRGVYWLLIGWWVARIRRAIIGTPW